MESGKEFQINGGTTAVPNAESEDRIKGLGFSSKEFWSKRLGTWPQAEPFASSVGLQAELLPAQADLPCKKKKTMRLGA